MTKKNPLLLILAFNELATIARTIKELQDTRLPLDILLVNDGSSDHTASIAKSLGVQVLDLPYQQGISKAEQAGFRFALLHRYDVAVRIDADGQHNPKEIPLLLTTLEKGGYGMVIGSRFLGKRAYQMPWARLWGIKMYAKVASYLTRQVLTDTTSGFRAYNKKVMAALVKQYPQDPGVETVIMLLTKGFRIKEVPIVMRPRQGGYSHMSAVRALALLGNLLVQCALLWWQGLKKIHMLNRLSLTHILLAIVVFSLACSFTFLFFFKGTGPVGHEVPGSDYGDIYEPMVQNLLAGKHLITQDKPYVSAPPGYSFYLVPLFILAKTFNVDELGLIIFFNTIAMAGAACFLFLTARAVIGPTPALLATTLWITYPLQLWFIKNPNTEVPFFLIFFAALWWFITTYRHPRIRNMIIVGVLLGLAMLIRPILLLFPFIAIAFLCWTNRSMPWNHQIKASVALLFGILIVISPWVWYASARARHFVPLSSVGPVAIKYGFSYALVGEGKYANTVSPDVGRLMQSIRYGPFSSNSDIFGFLFSSFIQQPLAVITLLSLKAARVWYGTYSLWWEGYILLLQLPYLFFGLVGIFIGMRTRSKKKDEYIFLLLLILYFWGITFIALSIVRYMIPAMAFVMIFAAITITSLRTYAWQSFKKA